MLKIVMINSKNFIGNKKTNEVLPICIHDMN